MRPSPNTAVQGADTRPFSLIGGVAADKLTALALPGWNRWPQEPRLFILQEIGGLRSQLGEAFALYSPKAL